MKRLLAMILVFALMFACVPVSAFAEDATDPTAALTEAPTEAPTVTAISVAAAPKKTEYAIGDALDLTGGSVTISMSDGTSGTVDMSACAASGFDSSTAGTCSVVLTYAGCSTSFYVTVIQPQPEVTVTGISVAVLPSKTQYGANEALDVSGGEIIVSYSDGSMQNMAMTAEMVSGFNNTVSCTQTLTVTYEGFEAYYDVTVTLPTTEVEPSDPPITGDSNIILTTPSPVSESVINSISLTTKPTKMQYILNQDTLDMSGAEITVYYSDGSTTTVSVTNEMVTGFDNTYVGTQWLTINYHGWSTNCKVAIVESEDKPLVVDHKFDPGNSKLVYYLNESLEIENAFLLLEYSNGTKINIPVTAEMITNFYSSIVGYSTLWVDYEGTSYNSFCYYYIVSPEILKGSCGDNATWEITDGVLTISGRGSVTSGYGWRDYRSIINAVVIEEGITMLGSYTFPSSNNLTTVKLPSTLVEIGSQAFENCVNLKTINFPEDLLEIGHTAFYNCSSLTDVVFPKSLTVIGSDAFTGCVSLREIVFPEHLNELNYDAFSNCTGLTEITFEGMRPPYSAYGERMVFDGVTAAGYYPGTEHWKSSSFFDYCGGDIEWIATEVEDTKPISWIGLTTKPTKIQYVQNQGKLDVSGGIITVYYTDDTTDTVEVTVDMVSGFNNTTLGKQWLRVWYQGYYTDYQIAIVESADKPLVMDYHFDSGNSRYCYLQNESILLDGATLRLEYSDGTEVSVEVTPEMVVDFDTTTTGYHYAYITYSGDQYGGYHYNVITRDNLRGSCGENAYWEISESGVLNISGSGEMTSSDWEFYDEFFDSVVIENGITTIYSGAFYQHERLANVLLPESITEIGSSAFYGCTGLTSITLPQGLTQIGYHAFYGCAGLTELVFPENISYLYENAFSNCTNLKRITFKGKYSPGIIWGPSFEGVTATGYYPGTTGWYDSFFENCGGDIEWIATGAVADRIKFYNTSYEIPLGKRYTLSVTAMPGNIAIDCDFTIDTDVAIVEKTSKYGCAIIPQKEGTATLTATDKRSGQTATATITIVPEEVNLPKTITCPYEEKMNGDDRNYTFTPTKTGTYVFSWINNNGCNMDQYDFCYEASYINADGETDFPDYMPVVKSGTSAHFQLELEAGITYSIWIGCYCYDESVETIDGTFRVDLATEPDGIEIIGGDRTIYGAVGETFGGGAIYYKLYPDNAVSDIIWESSNPSILGVEWDYDTYYLYTCGIGTAELTVKSGEFSDTINVTVKEPQKLELNTPVEKTVDTEQIFSFTPTETGRYAFEGGGNFVGKYMPEDMQYNSSVDFGTLMAGVTYYYEAYGSSVVVKKEVEQPIAIEVTSAYYGGSSMSFYASFVPVNAYEEIVSWESSNTDILDTNRYSSVGGTSHYFEIYGSGEVTVTAISESGLRGSCTVVVGQCYDGHTYGTWRQTKAKTCLADGEKTAKCINCGQSKTQTIPTTGHSYDNDCDTACNECGATRTALHDFSEKWGYSETVHWHICSVCGERSDIENHIPGAAATENAPQSCTECGYVIKSALGHSHSYGAELTIDETGHWYACSGCTARKNYNGHVYTSVCDAECNECGYIRKNVHVSGGTWVSDKAGHWQACTKCNTKLNYAAHVPGAPATTTSAQVCTVCDHELKDPVQHIYDNDCDAECNECGAFRTVEHEFGESWGYNETAHWHVCVNCGERSQILNHIPGTAATQNAPQTCTDCAYVIKGALGHVHNYATKLTLDETGHWYACSGCNARKNYNAHIYTDACDANCNDCGYSRKNIHVFGSAWLSDKTGHWLVCTKCSEKLNYATHQPGAAATANTAQICSICRYEIQKALGTTTTTTIVQTVTKPSNHTHKYSTMLTMDEVGHWYACTGCTSKQDYMAHEFRNDCDADCNICGYTRATSHATEAQWSADDVGHWYSCKDCGERVGYAYHTSENGTCMICKHAVKGAEKPTETPTEATIPAPTEETVVAENAGDSNGASVLMMIVAGMVSSIATFGIIAIVVWVNRKKIIALLIGK